MKKLVTTTGGHPLRLDDVKLLQDATIEGTIATVDAICRTYATTGVYLSGVNFTVVGLNTTASAGYIYYQGEIYPVDLQTVTVAIGGGLTRYWEIVEEVMAPSPVTYKDTTVHDVHIRRKAVISDLASPPTEGFTLSTVLRIEQIMGSPKNSIMPYYGPTSHFNGSGDGINGTPVYGYALCDGGTSALVTGGTFVRPNFKGRVLVGYDSSDANFNGVDGSNIPNETGGAKTHTLTKGEIPKHKHTVSTSTTDGGSVSVGSYNVMEATGSTYDIGDGTAASINGPTAHSHSISGNTGDGTTDGLAGGAHNNLQPYYTVLWIIKLY